VKSVLHFLGGPKRSERGEKAGFVRFSYEGKGGKRGGGGRGKGDGSLIFGREKRGGPVKKKRGALLYPWREEKKEGVGGKGEELEAARRERILIILNSPGERGREKRETTKVDQWSKLQGKEGRPAFFCHEEREGGKSREKKKGTFATLFKKGGERAVRLEKKKKKKMFLARKREKALNSCGTAIAPRYPQNGPKKKKKSRPAVREKKEGKERKNEKNREPGERDDARSTRKRRRMT